MIRCINIDWLELYCLEPARPRDAQFFRDHGWSVREREYGTRVYAEMFVLDGTDFYPLLEIRRKPISSVLEPNACHIRLTNRTCYFQDAIPRLTKFLSDYGYHVQRISRIDIALDFEKFDSGDDPQVFVRRYMRGKYAKINQSNISAHGRDDWSAREWNSLSWGSLSSPIGTKLYNKTLELREVKDKPYIRQAWFLTHLVDDPERLTRRRSSGEVYSPTIWRLEFSIRSAVKNWVRLERDGRRGDWQSVRNTLSMYDTREKMLSMFASLVRHYFHFKHYVEGRSKYKCDDKELFTFAPSDEYYEVEKVASPNKPDRDLLSLLSRLRHYRVTHSRADQRQAADALIKCIEDEDMSRLNSNPWSRAELQALQLAIAGRLSGHQTTVASILDEIHAIEESGDEIF